MKYIDYYIFSIYNTYKKLHRRAPRMIYGEPEFNAASVAALYPVLLIFSASLLFNVWGSLDLMVYQFFTVFIILLAFYFLGACFEARIIKAKASNSLPKIILQNIIIVNIFIFSVLIFTISCCIIKL